MKKNIIFLVILFISLMTIQVYAEDTKVEILNKRETFPYYNDSRYELMTYYLDIKVTPESKKNELVVTSSNTSSIKVYKDNDRFYLWPNYLGGEPVTITAKVGNAKDSFKIYYDELKNFKVLDSINYSLPNNNIIYVGETFDTKLSTTPSSATGHYFPIDYIFKSNTSSAEKTLKIDHSRLTGLGEGTVKIGFHGDGVPEKQKNETFTIKVLNKNNTKPVEDFELEEDEMQIYLGEEKQIKAIFTPSDTTGDKTLIYKNKKEDIISIDKNGKITPLKKGVAYVDVEYYFGNDSYPLRRRGLTVYVTNKGESAVPIKSFAYTGKTDINVGEKYQINVIKLPLNATDTSNIVYSLLEGEGTVATLTKDGLLTGLSEGEILVEANLEGTYYGLTFAMQVTNEKIIEPTSFTFKQYSNNKIIGDSIELEEGDTLKIKVDAEPENSSYGLTWYCDDESIAEFTSNSFTGYNDIIAKGKGTTKAHIISSNGIEKIITVKVNGAEKDISKATISSISNQIYTGKEITPSIIVKYNDNTLIKDKDYKLSYKNNINSSNDATIIIEGIGNYTGKVEKKFIIEKATYDMSKVIFTDATYEYDGKTHSLVATNLPSGVTVTYTNNDKVDAGTYNVIANFKGNSNYNTIPSKNAKLIINQKDISKLAVGIYSSYYYTGSEVKPDVTINDDNYKLVKDKDYTITYKNNINIGTATIIITGKGNYKGSRETTFKIVEKTYDLSKVTFNNSTITYDGNSHSIKAGGVPSGVEVVYTNNEQTNVGTYKITAKFYSNNKLLTTKEATLTIKPKSIATVTIESIANQIYTGKAVKPIVVVKDGNKTLKENTDYSVSYSNNISVGEAKITISGLNNYNSYTQKTFKIIKQDTTISVTGISLNKTTTSIEVGKTETLIATITPSNATNKTVTWTSSDTSMATVDSNGKVTAKKIGTATITATTSNGKTSTCKVTVIKKEVKEIKVSYRTHVENIGWQNFVSNGKMAGTQGQSLRLEAINIKLENSEYSGNIEYKTHIQNIGWENTFKKNNEMSGTSGQSLRLEAIEIKLTGEVSNHYDIYYRVHAQNFGWLGWAKNGEDAGTAGYAYRLEGIEIKLVEKGQTFSEYGKIEAFKGKIMYTTHVQNIGWQNYVSDGAMAGTQGQSLRLEAIKIKTNVNAYTGNIEYRTHIQNIGWESTFKKNGASSGTSGQSLRLEAIEIRLTGELKEHYDIYYRVHAQNFGWLGWAKNGESSGTAGYAYRLEGIEIVLVNKGENPPKRTNTNNQKSFIEKK